VIENTWNSSAVRFCPSHNFLNGERINLCHWPVATAQMDARRRDKKNSPQSGESEVRPMGRAAPTTICKSFGQLEYGANETEAIAAA